MKVVIDKKVKRRMYTLHRNLCKKGNDVETKQKFVTKRAKVLSEIEQKWCNELVNYGYCVGDGTGSPGPAGERGRVRAPGGAAR